MDTIVTAKIISEQDSAEIDAALQQALAWFGEVERVCSRFDPKSEVYRLGQTVGRPIAVSPLLFEAINFSVEVADASGGAFDPTVGGAQAQRGFDVNYLTRQPVAAPQSDPTATYEDVILNSARQTVELRKPSLLDLGAVVKGMAIDLAAKELSRFESVSVDAGGDIYVKGKNELGDPWRIGIEHPRAEGLIATLMVDDGAICTSGDYLRRTGPETDKQHHLLDPRTGRSPEDIISCTVVAPTAMAADALSTAAFVGGAELGLHFLEAQGADGMLVRQDLSISMTRGFERLLA